MSQMIHVGDALAVLKTMSDESVDCIITSPPYWGLRDYGVDGQLGLEKTPDEFIENMAVVFDEAKRVLKTTGTLWLNIGDSYVGTGNKGEARDPKYKEGRNGQAVSVNAHVRGLKSKDLVGIPWRLAFALQARGWYLRQDIIWHKPNPMPESVTDRCTKSHEYVFLLTKNKKYYYDAAAIKEPATGREFRHPYGWGQGDEPRTAIELQKEGIHKRTKHTGVDDRVGGTGKGLRGHSGNKMADGTILIDRNKRSVWSVSTQAFDGAHFATFPEKLIEPMILAGCPRGGAVMDPFTGSGTTGVVALKNNRHFIGIELNPEYAEMARERLSGLTMPMNI